MARSVSSYALLWFLLTGWPAYSNFFASLAYKCRVSEIINNLKLVDSISRPRQLCYLRVCVVLVIRRRKCHPGCYNDHPVTCHVSAIQKDSRLSLCNLPGYPDHLCSNACNTERVFSRGGAWPIWHPYVRLRARGKHHTSDRGHLDIGLCMGNPCAVSCSMDCYETLPWTATNINRMGSWGLFYDIDTDSRILLREFFLLFLAFTSSISLRRSRARIRLPLKSFLILFQLPKPCRCLCWDHVSSLAFETIRLNSWPTPTRELQWQQLLSRSTYKFQLAVACSAKDARIVHTRWVPYICGTHECCLVSFAIIFICCFGYGLLLAVYVHHHHCR